VALPRTQATGNGDGLSSGLHFGSPEVEKRGRKAVHMDQLPGSAGAIVRRPRLIASWITGSRYFDAVVGMVILANSITIGIDQSYKLQKEEAPLIKTLDQMFLCFYIWELGIRFFGGGLRILSDNSIKFDVCLVSFCIVETWLLDASKFEDVAPLIVLRMARLARMVRALRLVALCRELWMLVHGLMSSAMTMVYTLGLLTLIIYAFSLVGVELITMKILYSTEIVDPLVEGIVEEYFKTLPITMLTLTQFITLDSIGAIYRPLIVYDASLAVYFISVIMIVGIVLMNLVTAVLVNGAMEEASKNKEAARFQEAQVKKKLTKSLRTLFVRLDADGSGKIDRDELSFASPDDAALLNEYMKLADPIEVFNHLDVDGSGELDIDEFCEGLYQASISSVPVEFKRIDKRVELLHHQLTDVQDDLKEDLRQYMDGIREILDRGFSSSPIESSQLAAAPFVVDAGKEALLVKASIDEESWSNYLYPTIVGENHRPSLFEKLEKGMCQCRADMSSESWMVAQEVHENTQPRCGQNLGSATLHRPAPDFFRTQLTEGVWVRGLSQESQTEGLPAASLREMDIYTASLRDTHGVNGNGVANSDVALDMTTSTADLDVFSPLESTLPMESTLPKESTFGSSAFKATPPHGGSRSRHPG